MQDLITDTAYNACSGENDIYFSIMRIEIITDARIFGDDKMERSDVQ